MRNSTSSFLALLFVGMVLQSCVKNKPIDPLKFAGKSVILGSGGGFTGAEQQYRLLDNGQLYHRSLANEEFRLLKAKSKGKAKKWVARFDSLSHANTAHADPGNTYKYVVFEQDSIQNRIVWGGKQGKPDDKITTFYQEFLDYWVYKRKAE